MRRLLATLLAVLLVCSISIPVFAAQDEKENNVTVKYVTTVDGAYVAEVINGTASISADGVTICVTGAPSTAKTLVVIPMAGDALSWIDSCVDGDAKAAYDIHFEDTEGNRISANGANVSVSVSGSELTVSSVNTSGTNKNLSSTTSDGSVSFTTDGNYYYVISEKDGGETPDLGDTITVPIRGGENEIHADVTIDDDTVELHELDFDEIDHIVGDHVNTGIVEIDLTELDEKITKIELPMASIKHIVEAAEEAHNDTEALQIDFPNGSVKLDDKALRAIIDTVGEETTVDLVLEPVETDRLNNEQKAAVDDLTVYGGVEVYLLCNTTSIRVSDFKGGVATMYVPFTLPEGVSADKISVWHIADDGTKEKMNTSYENGVLTWEVGHFSDFIIATEKSADPGTDPIEPTEPNLAFLWWLIPVSLVTLVGSGFAIYWFVIKKKTWADLVAIFRKSKENEE